MSVRNLKRRRLALYVASFFVSVLPVLFVVWINRADYVATIGQTIKMAAGGAMAAVFVIMKVMGKLKMPRRVVAFALIFLMAYLLEPVLTDLMFLSGAAFGGELADEIIFRQKIAKITKKINIEETSDATAKKIESVLQNYIGGRV